MKTLIPDHWHAALARTWQQEVNILVREEQSLQLLLRQLCDLWKRDSATRSLRRFSQQAHKRILRLQGVAEVLGLVIRPETQVYADAERLSVTDITDCLERAAENFSAQIVRYGNLAVYAQCDGNFAGVILLNGNRVEHQEVHSLLTQRIGETKLQARSVQYP